jgi:hypothetical protein
VVATPSYSTRAITAPDTETLKLKVSLPERDEAFSMTYTRISLAFGPPVAEDRRTQPEGGVTVGLVASFSMATTAMRQLPVVVALLHVADHDVDPNGASPLVVFLIWRIHRFAVIAASRRFPVEVACAQLPDGALESTTSVKVAWRLLAVAKASWVAKEPMPLVLRVAGAPDVPPEAQRRRTRRAPVGSGIQFSSSVR